MSIPAVSVLMNCFNGERFIADAIRSVLAQTEQDFELVVWDNQSTDQSAIIVGRFEDPRIHYHRSDRHTTLAEARRLALPLLRGEWIGFLDVDDLWRPRKLERQLAALDDQSQAGFAYCGVALLDQSDGQLAQPADHVFARQPDPLPEGNLFPELLRGNFIAIASLLVNRRKLIALGGLRGRYPIMEDYDMSLRLARHHPTVAVQEVLCDYRIHGANDSLKGPVDHFEDLDIVRTHFPHPLALVAAGRIILRHFRKCAARRKPPQLAILIRTLLFGQPRPQQHV